MRVKLELHNVGYRYSTIPVLRSIDLLVEPGEVVVIGGRTGYGKSTLLEICAGLKEPHSGKVFWNGECVAGFSKDRLLMMRRSIGFVFQAHALISNHTVFDNIALPLRCRGEYRNSEIIAMVKHQMEELNIFNIDTSYPELLSAGQLKSVAAARALVTNPDILFLDETFSGVDPVTAQGILNVLYSRRQKNNMSIVLVCHNPDVWSGENAKRYILDGGMLIENDKREFSRNYSSGEKNRNA